MPERDVSATGFGESCRWMAASTIHPPHLHVPLGIKRYPAGDPDAWDLDSDLQWIGHK
jgi:hypothetical protein